jgi:hypothetical protein
MLSVGSGTNPVFIVFNSAMAPTSRQRCLTDSEMATLVNAKEDLTDSGYSVSDSEFSTDVEEDNVMRMAIFWVVAPCSLVEVYRLSLSDYMAQQPRRQPSSYLPP